MTHQLIIDFRIAIIDGILIFAGIFDDSFKLRF